jgi:hypothetical protein
MPMGISIALSRVAASRAMVSDDGSPVNETPVLVPRDRIGQGIASAREARVEFSQAFSPTQRSDMVKRRRKRRWFWLLLLLLPLGWFWWRDREPKVTGEPPLADPPAERASTTTDQPKVAKEAPLPPPRLALPEKPSLPPPPANPGTTAPLIGAPGLAKTAPAPLDVSDAAIAALSPETISMLNRHKYWSAEKGALVDGLHDVWVDKKQQGVDVEDVRKQIGWALRGIFMEEY